MISYILSIFLILTIAFLTNADVHAAPNSPFLGHWEANDIDGSDLGLTIGGPPNGPFQITLIDDYIGFCDGEAGIVRGTGLLNMDDPNLLEADVHLECLTTGDSLELHITFRYHPDTNTLSSGFPNGWVTVYQRPGHPLFTPPFLSLRVNYGHDWVESFYEAGHTVWVTVTESDGQTVKATAQLITEPKDFWDGETGFTTNPEDWYPAPPDIQPYDWVYGWVDNSASSLVQIGEIFGNIGLGADSIEGTILAPWFSDPLDVECHPWGAPEGAEMKYDTAVPDGDDPYACSWAGEWDVQPYQDIAVWYFGPDGHWVANVFFSLNPRIVASEAGDWFWMTEFKVGMLDLFLYESADEGAVLLWSGNTEVTDTWGFTTVDYDMHGQDMVPGNYLVVSDGVNSKGLVLEMITIEVFDTENEIIAGTAPAGRDVVVVAGMAGAETQATIYLTADSETGAWLADFTTMDFDITEDMRPWSFAQIFDGDGDANEADVPPLPHVEIKAFPMADNLWGYGWPEGSEVHLTLNGAVDFVPPAIVGPAPWGDPNDIMAYFELAGYDLVPGDVITLSGSGLEQTYTVLNLSVTAVDAEANTVTGMADQDLYIWVHGYDGTEQYLTPVDGIWLADFNPFDLTGGMCGRAEISDEFGNSTAVDWCVPNPHFSVFPEWEWFDGMDWPDGATVYISVEGKACDTSVESWGGFFNGGFPEECDIVAGDIVTFTDGTTTRTHTVRNLSVTGWNVDADTLSGLADPETQLVVWPHEHDDVATVFPVAGPDGTWTADFSAVGFDLVENMGGRAEVHDEFDNATSVDWWIPNPPRLAAYPVQDFVVGWDWPLGAMVTMTIDDPSNGSGVDFEQTTEVVVTPFSPDVWWAMFEFAGTYDLKPGDFVVLTDGATTREHVVLPLSVDIIDAETDTVAGTSAPDAWVYVHPWEVTFDPVQADSAGNWQMFFEGLYDLQAGTNGLAEVFEEDGDSTAIDWQAPPAMTLRVNYGHDWVESFYEAGHQVTLTVTEADGETVKASATAFTEPKDYWDGESGFTTNETGWDGGTPPDLQSGDWVFASVDNGVTAQVQLGDIQGEVFIFEDRISGMINAPWLSEQVQVECMDWGSGGDAGSKIGGVIYTNGSDTYSCAWDPESEWDLQAWQDVGVSYFTPDGHWVANAFHAEHWIAMWTHDLSAGFWTEGEHSYYFQWENTIPSPGGGTTDPLALTISSISEGGDTQIYPGYALLWGFDFAPQLAWTGEFCEMVPVIHPDQPTRFVFSFVNGESMSYEEAWAFLTSLIVHAFWDEEAGGSAQLTMGEVVPYYGVDATWDYRCSFTDHP